VALLSRGEPRRQLACGARTAARMIETGDGHIVFIGSIGVRRRGNRLIRLCRHKAGIEGCGVAPQGNSIEKGIKVSLIGLGSVSSDHGEPIGGSAGGAMIHDELMLRAEDIAVCVQFILLSLAQRCHPMRCGRTGRRSEPRRRPCSVDNVSLNLGCPLPPPKGLSCGWVRVAEIIPFRRKNEPRRRRTAKSSPTLSTRPSAIFATCRTLRRKRPRRLAEECRPHLERDFEPAVWLPRQSLFFDDRSRRSRTARGTKTADSRTHRGWLRSVPSAGREPFPGVSRLARRREPNRQASCRKTRRTAMRSTTKVALRVPPPLLRVGKNKNLHWGHWLASRDDIVPTAVAPSYDLSANSAKHECVRSEGARPELLDRQSRRAHDSP